MNRCISARCHFNMHRRQIALPFPRRRIDMNRRKGNKPDMRLNAQTQKRQVPPPTQPPWGAAASRPNQTPKLFPPAAAHVPVLYPSHACAQCARRREFPPSPDSLLRPLARARSPFPFPRTPCRRVSLAWRAAGLVFRETNSGLLLLLQSASACRRRRRRRQCCCCHCRRRRRRRFCCP